MKKGNYGICRALALCILLLAVLFALPAAAAQTIPMEGPADITLKIGETKALGVTTSVEGAHFTYSLSDASVATVDEEGNITGLFAGEANLMVKADRSGYSDTLKLIRVSVSRGDQVIEAEDRISLFVGDTAGIGSKAKTTMSYTSSDPSVITVDDAGNLEAVAKGQAVITIDAKGTSKFNPAHKEVQVEVNRRKQQILTGSLALQVGETGNLRVKTRTSRTYSSSDESVARVSGDGDVTGYREGTAVITIKAKSTSIFDSAETQALVTVSSKGQKIDAEDMRIGIDETVPLNVVSSTSRSYTSSDPEIVQVDEKGNVTGAALGKAYIIIKAKGTTKYNSASTICEITVVKRTQNLTLQDFEMTVGEEKGLSVKANTSLTFVSSDENIVSVDKNGTVTGLSPGTARISVTARETSRFERAETDAMVTVKRESQTIKGKNLELFEGDSAVLDVSTATSRTYTSSDPSIATVSEDGVVTAVSRGTAIITVQAMETRRYEGAEGSFTVTVTGFEIIPSGSQRSVFA
ncbi:MAG: Ig-like domain-containing protein [Blautia sp.]|nr:Ig-like domain-containing protein [Blautia sp.]